MKMLIITFCLEDALHRRISPKFFQSRIPSTIYFNFVVDLFSVHVPKILTIR